MPNLLQFREYPYICTGIYDGDRMIGTFIIHPYTCLINGEASKGLRIERPLLLPTLPTSTRRDAIETMKTHVHDYARTTTCQFVEMELYAHIDESIFFPASLATVGTFNSVEDYPLLVDHSFDLVHTTICLELTRDPHRTSKRPKLRWLSIMAAKLNLNPGFQPLTERHSVLEPYAFNLPEYCLLDFSTHSMLYWFPNLYELAAHHWHGLLGERDAVHDRIRRIHHGKIVLTLGRTVDDLLRNIDEVWAAPAFSAIDTLQLFAEDHGHQYPTKYPIIHRLNLLRQQV